MWANWDKGPGERLTPSEQLAEVQRVRREHGLPDYAEWCAELLMWVARGSMSADGAVAWLRLWDGKSKL
jgi:hypothetical protein